MATAQKVAAEPVAESKPATKRDRKPSKYKSEQMGRR
jgi:hypothetical protein